MRIPATKLKQLWAENPDKMAHALAESLREFGYNLTDQYVKEQITKLSRWRRAAWRHSHVSERVAHRGNRN